MALVKTGENYSPLYFLASLGSGGLSVSFFMYIMFLIPHPETPLITADKLFPMITAGTYRSVLILAVFAGILYFAYLHFRLLAWNIGEYNRFKKTENFMKLKESNKAVGLMAIPLTYAMTINVCFVLGATFVPGLWNIVEYMFPFAILGFVAVGVYGLKIFMEYFTRIITKGGFDFAENNNLSQMLAIFAFAMVAVGLAAPGAMSHYKEISSIGLFLSIFFASVSLLLLSIKLVLGFKAILEHGISKEASGSLWIIIPILTLLGITFVRWSFGFSHNFMHEQNPSFTLLFILTSAILSVQVIFGLLGYFTMKQNGYFDEYINSDKKSPAAFALICPGVAFFVFGFFFLIFGLVKNGIVGLNTIPFFVLMLPFVYIQIKTILTMRKLNAKMLFTRDSRFQESTS